MRIHPREQLVREAQQKLRTAISGVEDEFKLTTAEWLQVVVSVLSDDVLSTLKFAIRQERHGNTDTPGGLAGD